MPQCPKGMKYVPGGRVGYTAYSYPRGTETCTPLMCKPGRHKIPPHIRRITVPTPCPQKCTINNPITQRARKSVAGFCVSPLVTLGSFIRFGQRVKLPWSRYSGGLHFTEVNKGRTKSSPVLDVSYLGAVKYCRYKYGNGSRLPSEKQWEHARQKGKITIKRTRTMEILNTVARTLAQGGLMYLMAGLYPTTGRKVAVRSAVAPQIMSSTSVFRCVAQTGTRGRAGHF